MRIEGLVYTILRTLTLDYRNDPPHVRDRRVVEFSAVAAFIENCAVGERYVSTHDAPEVRHQYFGGVFPFLKDASGDEVDVDVAPLQEVFNQHCWTLDDTVLGSRLPYPFAFRSISAANDTHSR